MFQKFILKLSLISFGLSFFSFSNNLHPLKATSLRLNYNDAAQLLTIEVEIFRDDFQNCLNKEYNSRYDLFRFYNQKEPLQAVNNFFNKYIVLQLNGKAILLNCTKGENNDEKNSFTFTMEIPKTTIKPKQKLKITNSILFNYFSNQSNIIVISILKLQQKMYQFNKDYFTETIEL